MPGGGARLCRDRRLIPFALRCDQGHGGDRCRRATGLQAPSSRLRRTAPGKHRPPILTAGRNFCRVSGIGLLSSPDRSPGASLRDRAADVPGARRGSAGGEVAAVFIKHGGLSVLCACAVISRETKVEITINESNIAVIKRMLEVSIVNIIHI